MTVRPLPWMLRVAWATQPFAAGATLATATAEWHRAPRVAASTGLWIAWTIGLCACLVPHPISLTVTRVIAPAAVVVAAAATLSVGLDPASAMSLAATGATAVVANLAGIGRWCVEGTAYPNEARFPLRVPPLLLIGPVFVSWALVVALPAAAVLLLASERWAAGVPIAGLALVVLAILGRALHGLSRRWLVFVPAGLVVHDPLALRVPVLFERKRIVSLAPSVELDTLPDEVDLTRGSIGPTLDLQVQDGFELQLARPAITRRGTRLRIAPTRPAAVLAEAAARRYPSALST